jgi:hypothetical protein
MRGLRLNGWQRIGIVLSVMWILVVGAMAFQEHARQLDFLRQCLSSA